MKLMFCGNCGDIVSPGLADLEVRWCACRRHAVWWIDGGRGILRVHDAQMPERNGGDGGRAWVLGLHNGVLHDGGLVKYGHAGNEVTTKAQVERLIDETPDTYVFKRARSLVVRFAPGYTGDTAWSQLPEA